MENPFLFPKQNGYKSDFHAISRQKNAGCQKRSQGGKKPGGEMGSPLLVALGPMCDAEKDWDERFFRASGEIITSRRTGNQLFFLYFWTTSGVFSKAFLML